MRKRTFLMKRILPVLLFITLVLGSVPAAAEELTSGEAAAEILESEEGLYQGDSLLEDGEVTEEKISGDEFLPEDKNQDKDPSEDGLLENGIRYIKDRPLTEEEREEQISPMENLKNLPRTPQIKSNLNTKVPSVSASNFPSSYDARKQGLVTPVKFQDPYNNCWSFAVASAMETALLDKGLGSYDLSEEHLSYFFANRANDPLGNTAGDINYHYGVNINGDRDYHEGGNTFLAALFLSSWSGMATEAEFPLMTDSSHTQFVLQKLDPSDAYKTTAYMKDAVFSGYSVARMKQLLTRYKSVAFSLCMADSYYNADTAAFSNPREDAWVNHSVTAVGWDDNYAKENFPKSSNVTTDGAWIVKNTWSEYWGDGGYFYVSYEDATIADLTCVTAETAPAYRNNYFYDGSCGETTISLEKGEAVACIYRASAGKGKAEILGEIATSTYGDNSHFSIQVYTELKDPADPTSGTAAYSSPVDYVQVLAGVDSISVPEVMIAPDSLYSVVLTNVGSNKLYYSCESAVDYDWFAAEAGLAPNQGFLIMNNCVYDLLQLKTSPRIKAHTRTENTALSMKLSNTGVTITDGTTKNLSVTVTPGYCAGKGFVYTSSNPAVAKVDNAGRITAVSPGSAVITCKCVMMPNLQASCKVTVLPKTPGAVRTEVKDYNKIRISWTEVPGCDGYTVYRQEAGQQIRGRASLKGQKATYYYDKDIVTGKGSSYIKPGVRYTYSVRAYKLINGKKVYGGQSPASTAVARLGTTGATARANNNGYNIITWKPAAGAEGYYVYRRAMGGDWKCIAVFRNTKTFSFRDKKIRPLETWQYRVKCYRDIEGKRYFSPYISSGKLTAAPAVQRISSITSRSDGLKVAWNPQNRCSGYRIYRRTGNGSYKMLADQKGGSKSSYLDTGAKKGVTYTYCVRAYVNEFYGPANSRYVSRSGVRR